MHILLSGVAVGCEVINLGGDSPHSLVEVITMIEDEAGRPARVECHPVCAADVMATWAGSNKARSLVGWHPEVGLREGVARMFAWNRGNRSWGSDEDTWD